MFKSGIVFVTRVTYHWNQRISETQNQVQKHMGYPKMGGCQVSFLISMGLSHCPTVTIRDKGPRALIFLTHITICIIFVNRDIYHWNQRSLLSQKQVERHMAYTLRNMDFAQVRHCFCDLCDIPLESAHLRDSESGTKTHGLPKNGFRFFVRTFITEKTTVQPLPSEIKARRSLLSQKQGTSSQWHIDKVERHMAYTLVQSIFSSGHLHQSKVRITLNNSVRTLNGSVIWTLLKSGIVFVTRVTYHWNQRISETQNQVQKHMGYPKMVRISGVISHLGRVPATVQPLPSEIKARVRYLEITHVERHMAYTLVQSIFSSGHLHQSKVRITLNNSVRTLNGSVIWTLLKSGIVFVTRVTYHWNQRISETQNQVRKYDVR
ncbi:hypothetical protein PROFUN_16908 [Planoprotostelium fungivorum]|uniref:Uncharacterized protein n=1 Tax=Planoprotostelium fungivorum TaxID=1890364 RepID=A0A2P6MMH4_9EUKA|nr:hypothetical protein PROFUN_16908 [Planoprotostelium fungivorum]